MNCRDLGGYAAAGGVTRWGVFYRSEAPCGLPEEGIAYFRALGLGESIDLRGEAEIAWRPAPWRRVFPYRRISLPGGAETFEKKNLPEGPFSWDKVYIKRAREHRELGARPWSLPWPRPMARCSSTAPPARIARASSPAAFWARWA